MGHLATSAVSVLAFSIVAAGAAVTAPPARAQALVQTIERQPPEEWHRFGGFDPTMDGDELLIGCPWDEAIGGGTSGIVYRFVRDADRFGLSGTIGDATTSAPGSGFGMSIVIQGDRMVVSAPGWNSAAGRAFEFERIGGDWVRTETITPALWRNGEQAGQTLAWQGEYLVMGAPNFNDEGRAILFKDTQFGWQEVRVLLPGKSQFRDNFGYCVLFLAPDVMAIGAPGLGEVYVYRLAGDVWIEEQVLTDTPGFGVSLAASDGVLFVGHTGDSEAAFRAGAVYAFSHDGSSWVQLDKMLPSGAFQDLQLGHEISCDGDRLLVGAKGEAGHGNYGQGRAYVFERTGAAEWTELATFDGPAGPQAGDGGLFAYGALLVENLAFCSANTQNAEDGTSPHDGAVYIFDLTRRQAPLIDVNVAFGTFISGELNWLRRSGNALLRVRSSFGFTSAEPNVLDIRIGAESPLSAPAFIDLSIEGRISQSGGTSRVRLRNWSTNQFQQLHQYSIGTTEFIEDIDSIDATNRVRSTDQRIELSIRQSVMIVFSSAGFDSFTDWVGVAVQ